MSRTVCDPETVKGVLKELDGIEPLKQLFWAELNYKRINENLPRRGWSETATDALADDPLVFATGGHDDSFKVIYARLKSEKLLSGQARPVVSQLLQKLSPYALFVFSNETQDRWQFINIKPDNQSHKKQIFRRITVGPEERLGERLRTAAERIAMLDLGEDSDWIRSLRHPLSVNDIQNRHDEAFNVETLNKQFFSTFAELYHKVVDDINMLRGFEKNAKPFAHVLLNRMLFLYFIQKKGWLDNKQDYLYSRFKLYKNDPNSHSYYSDVLFPLFASLSNPDVKSKELGAVPFLNGGLFEEKHIPPQAERSEQNHLKIRNSTFKTIFEDLLEKYNFTVMEDTPFSIEIAVNPDMLGRIFESLILELEKDPDKDLRRLTGSYYTPRPIVHFMCQEALKEYLVTKLVSNNGLEAELVRSKIDALMAMPPADELGNEQIEALVEHFTPSEAKLLHHAIFDCRVCDPAVGSGAFPVGMLHEMVAVIARLDLRVNGPEVLKRRNYYYDLKKQIVQTCLYGVDIQEQAVRLCELRLWLSLVVDYQIDQSKPLAQAINEILNLPNLSFRIVRGDSLLERLFGHVVQLDEMTKDDKTKQLIASLQKDKREHFLAGRLAEKCHLEQKILAKQAELAEILIEQKKASMIAYQTNLFGEEGLTAKERRAKVKFETQLAELSDLRGKVAKAKAELARLAHRKAPLRENDLATLRNVYFQNGEAPTFMWRVEFAEVFLEKGGFDIAIANPPYILFQKLKVDKFLVEAFKNLYRTATYKLDTYQLFYEITHRLLSSNGILAFISPNTFLRNKYAYELRAILAKEHAVRHLVLFFVKVFNDPSVDVCIFLSKRQETGIEANIFNVTVVESRSPTIEDLKTANDAKQSRVITHPRFEFDILSTQNEWVSRLEEITDKLGKYVDAYFGIQTYDRNAYVSKIRVKGNWKPCIDGGNVSRYMLTPCNENVLFEKHAIKSGGKKSVYENERIVVRQIGKTPIATICPAGVYALNTLYNIYLRPETKANLRVILALLNSKLLQKYWEIKYFDHKSTFPKIKKVFLLELPIFFDSSSDALLARLVDKIIKLKENGINTDEIEREIDKIVYSRYGLSEYEITQIQSTSLNVQPQHHCQPMQKAGIQRQAKAA